MALKVTLIAIIILIGLVVIIPFVLNIAGVKVFQFGAVGGGSLGSAGEGMLRSPDGGENWEGVSAVSRRDSFPSSILSFAFHPQNLDIVFLGAKSSGLWRSIDGGKSWHKLTDRTGVLDLRSDVYKVALGRENPNLIYLAVFQGGRGLVLRSENGGTTFSEVYLSPAARAGVFDIYLDPQNEKHVLIVTGDGGILESQNSGRSWRVKRRFTEAITRLIIHPLIFGEMYVITSSGNLLKSVDGGENWTDLTDRLRGTGLEENIIPTLDLNPFSAFSALGRQALEALILDPNDPETLYAGSKEGLTRSRDGAFTWKKLDLLIPPEALPISAVAVHPKNRNLIFAGASNQLHRSEDGGVNWSIDILPTKLRIRGLIMHPLKPEIMFAILAR